EGVPRSSDRRWVTQLHRGSEYGLRLLERPVVLSCVEEHVHACRTTTHHLECRRERRIGRMGTLAAQPRWVFAYPHRRETGRRLDTMLDHVLVGVGEQAPEALELRESVPEARHATVQEVGGPLTSS